MTPPPARLVGALADRYRIERELGAGGMATVYLAEDLKHKRHVALKVLKPELAAVLGAERFVQEITTTASLSHPHILPLFDSGEADGFLFYVMPFVDGETLRGKLDRETQLGVDEAVKITTEVADALEYAHQHGVIHRDIKPENILLQGGRPMVADFGIALAVSAAAGGRMTETGLSLGTPHYMSPEQATAEKEITARSDVYSLASVCYEMLAGQPPHLGGSAQQIIMKIIAEPVEQVTRYRKAVPPNVAAALAKALEKLPADRFHGAKAFSDALLNPGFRTASGPGAGAADSEGYVLGVRVARGRRASIVHGILTLALASGLAWALWGRSPTPSTSAPWVTDLALPDSARVGAGISLAADGSLLVYGGVGSESRIWMRRAGSLGPTPIPGTERACCPALSPDGQRFAFVRGGEARTAPLSGGQSTAVGAGFVGGDDIAWTSDGYLIGSSSSRGLQRVSADGGPTTSFTRIDSVAGEQNHWSPRALPDGRGVIFSIVPWDPNDSLGIRIGVVGPEGGPHEVLMPGRVAAYAHPGHLLVTRTDGSLVAVPFDVNSRRITGDPVPLLSGLGSRDLFTWTGYTAVANTGTLVYVGGQEAAVDLVWVGPAGAVVEVDSAVVGVTGAVRVSRDGRFVAIESIKDNVGGIDVRDRISGATSRVQVTGGAVEEPSFSADNRSLVFRVVSSGSTGIYIAELDRLSQRRVLVAEERVGRATLSADGRTLHFARGTERGAVLVARPIDGTVSDERVVATPTPTRPLISPDGRWIAYVSSESGTRQVYVQSADTSRTERWIVSRAARGALAQGVNVRWSPDGRQLYFIAGEQLVAAQVAGGETFSVGRLTTLFPVSQYLPSFEVFGSGFLFFRRTAGVVGAPLMMVQDWRALLRSR